MSDITRDILLYVSRDLSDKVIHYSGLLLNFALLFRTAGFIQLKMLIRFPLINLRLMVTRKKEPFVFGLGKKLKNYWTNLLDKMIKRWLTCLHHTLALNLRAMLADSRYIYIHIHLTMYLALTDIGSKL